jgi:hypothetical protein
VGSTAGAGRRRIASVVKVTPLERKYPDLTYQRMIAAYRQPDRTRGRELMNTLIEPVSTGVQQH